MFADQGLIYGDRMLVIRRSQDDPRLVDRLDPGYWRPCYEAILAACRVPTAPLGRFITHIAYGPIVTGRKPPPCEEGLPVVHQGQVAETGVDLRGAVRVAPGGPWDNPRARLQREDIVLPRSGVASVGKNRVAVYLSDDEAVVGSFVDLVRLGGIDPIYALPCMKTELVWSQIHRVINGIGTPNISFEEVRSLQVPLLDENTQLDFRARYLDNVHDAHLQWLEGHEEAGERAREALRRLVAELDAMIAGGQ